MSADRQDIVKCLTQARELIVKHGWIQGRFGNEQCGYCILGAIAAASSSMRDPDLDAAAELAIMTEQAFRRSNGGANISISLYNDAYGREKKDVLHAFDQTIEMVHRGGE